MRTKQETWCRHFAEAPAACDCMCDNCQRQLKADKTDASAVAQQVIDTLQNLSAADKRLTLTQLVEASRKSKVTSAFPLLLFFLQTILIISLGKLLFYTAQMTCQALNTYVAGAILQWPACMTC